MQERRPVPKSRRFHSLETTSGIQGRVLVDNCPVGMPPALCPLNVQPYGQDPVFNPFSAIFDDGLPGLEGNYYNTTTVGCNNCWHDSFRTQFCLQIVIVTIPIIKIVVMINYSASTPCRSSTQPASRCTLCNVKRQSVPSSSCPG